MRRRLISRLRSDRWRGRHLLTAFNMKCGTLLERGCTYTDDMTAPDTCRSSTASMVPSSEESCMLEGGTRQELRGRGCGRMHTVGTRGMCARSEHGAPGQEDGQQGGCSAAALVRLGRVFVARWLEERTLLGKGVGALRVALGVVTGVRVGCCRGGLCARPYGGLTVG